ncbi:hypothetical protein [Methylobacter svalbardensis]|uniref:hypothetical protein n=1 Tax=Methylobacter svalbardensis TaxID=3080016 RepID=UPI0030EDA393
MVIRKVILEDINCKNEAKRIIAAGIAGIANRGTVSQAEGQKASVPARAVEFKNHVLEVGVIHFT